MKKSSKILLGIVAVFLLLQLYRPKVQEQDIRAFELQSVPDHVNDILRNSCFDCHSSYANLRWYDKITPVNFFVNYDMTMFSLHH